MYPTLNIYRKPTWTGQYINFNSFVPLKIKRNLIRCLTERALRICSNDSLDSELENIRNIFLQNDYPLRLIDKTIMSTRNSTQVQTAKKKNVFITLPFKGDSPAELVTRRLKHVIGVTYYAANLCLSFSSTPLIQLKLKDKLPKSTTSCCVYTFECSCRASYVGRTMRCLSERIREHCPASLSLGVQRSYSSSIASHLMESKHRINPEMAFKIIYRAPVKFSRLMRFKLLSIAEAVAIRLFNPILCVQKKLIRSLTLCWPAAG